MNHPKQTFVTRLGHFAIAFAAAGLFWAALHATGAVAAPAPPSAEIVGGSPVPSSPTAWPSTVAIMPTTDPLDQSCAGSLVAASWVLTAAHCDDPDFAGGAKFVLAGQKNLAGSGGQVIAVDAAFPYPFPLEDQFADDIVLLHLAQPAVSPAAPIALASVSSDEPADNALVKLAGWGSTVADGSLLPNDLQETTIENLGQLGCLAYDLDYVGKMFCADHFSTGGADPDRGPCLADDGDPATYNGGAGEKLVGVLSYSADCATAPFPAVFMNVRDYKSWIDDTLATGFGFSRKTIDFGAVNVQGTPAQQSVSVKNYGTQPVEFGDAVPFANNYSIANDGCKNVSLPPGASCTVVVAFHSPKVGVFNGGFLQMSKNQLGFGPVAELSATAVGDDRSTAFLSITGTAKNHRIVSKRVKKRRRATISVVVFGSPACSGTASLHVKIKGVKKPITGTGNLAKTKFGCQSDITITVPKKPKRRIATITATFSGNASIQPQTMTMVRRIY